MPKVAGKLKPNRKNIKRRNVTFRILATLLDIIRIPYVYISIILLILITSLYQTGHYHKMVASTTKKIEYISEKNGLIIKDILLEGHHYTPKEDILNAITGNEKIAIGDSILNIDLWSIKDRLENLPWIKYASVERQYPSTLSVSIIE